MPNREYMIPVRLVIGTEHPLDPRERVDLINEVNATLAIHLDIPGALMHYVHTNPVNGEAYVKMRSKTARRPR